MMDDLLITSLVGFRVYLNYSNNDHTSIIWSVYSETGDSVIWGNEAHIRYKISSSDGIQYRYEIYESSVGNGAWEFGQTHLSIGVLVHNLLIKSMNVFHAYQGVQMLHTLDT